MEHLEKNYNPECWGCIGPLLITTCIKLFTGVILIKIMISMVDNLLLQKQINDITISTGLHVLDWKEIITAYIYNPTG